ncbi:FAD-dependent oxidoreductase [candidate division KSB1 bacterium]
MADNFLHSDTRKVVVIGASAAGMKAACRARRLAPRTEVIVVEAGEYISYAACGMPYFLEGEIASFDELRKTPYDLIKDPDYFSSIKDVSVMTGVRAVAIDRDSRILTCIEAKTENKINLTYDTLVIATGARPARPDIPGINLPGVFTFTRAEDAIALKKDCETGQVGSVAIIGGGYIGIELCEAFASLWGIEVTLIESEEHVLPGLLGTIHARHVESILSEEGIRVHTSTRCTAVLQAKNGLKIETDTNHIETVFDRIICASGIIPESTLARDAGLTVGETGGIAVNDYLQTSDPDIYAGGDCIEFRHRLNGKPVLLPLGSLANRTGRTIGDNISGITRKFDPVLGSTILKAFDCNIASVGLNAEHAKNSGFDTGEIWGVFDDKAHYYPGAERIYASMVFDRKSEKVLGVQAVGAGDVIRRIDTAAALMQFDAKISDFFDFEPAYAPPFANPLDPLHYLAYSADSILRDNVCEIAPDSLYKAKERNYLILDVRNDNERESDPVPEGIDAVAIPLNRLRDKFGELPAGREIVILCQKGPRAYEAFLILREKGFADMAFLGGGMLFARLCKGN